ncbi:hypothetical protein C8R44DRAFT_234037 [Mycena epipterygia]|nr:hypothetical protein C8R44DRAFT_234037 [Mycena epipterygia]
MSAPGDAGLGRMLVDRRIWQGSDLLFRWRNPQRNRGRPTRPERVPCSGSESLGDHDRPRSTLPALRPSNIAAELPGTFFVLVILGYCPWWCTGGEAVAAGGICDGRFACPSRGAATVASSDAGASSHLGQGAPSQRCPPSSGSHMISVALFWGRWPGLVFLQCASTVGADIGSSRRSGLLLRDSELEEPAKVYTRRRTVAYPGQPVYPGPNYNAPRQS